MSVKRCTSVLIYMIDIVVEKILAREVITFKSHQYYVRKATTEVGKEDDEDDKSIGNRTDCGVLYCVSFS